MRKLFVLKNERGREREITERERKAKEEKDEERREEDKGAWMLKT